jgi:hypothetical protein
MGLNMKRKEKITIASGLSLGVLASTCSIVRTTELQSSLTLGKMRLRNREHASLIITWSLPYHCLRMYTRPPTTLCTHCLWLEWRLIWQELLSDQQLPQN